MALLTSDYDGPESLSGCAACGGQLSCVAASKAGDIEDVVTDRVIETARAQKRRRPTGDMKEESPHKN
jgi:hypothetical protein